MSLRLAVKRAFDSEFERARVGAVIVKGGRVLSSACNSIRGARGIGTKKAPESLHAEAAAIKKVLDNGNPDSLRGSILYVARLTSNGKTCNLSKPCEYCEKLLRDKGIRRVIYTTETGTSTTYNLR